MNEITFCDNIIDFLNELYNLLKEDWIKFKKFVKENKNYLIWLFIAIITLQFTDILSLGSSWNKYCKKNNIQNGGANDAVSGSDSSTATNTSDSPEATKELSPTEEKAAKKASKKKSIEEAKKKLLNKAEDKKAKKDGKNSKTGEGEDGEESVKSIDKKLSFFNKLKGKIQSVPGKPGLAGPIFGNMEGIFNAVGGMFTLAAVILVFIGIISLPVLIFIVITYCVIKKMVSKFVIF